MAKIILRDVMLCVRIWRLCLSCAWVLVASSCIVGAATDFQKAEFARAVLLSKSSSASDHVAARSVFENLAAEGILEAKFNLGTLLAEGKGGPADFKRARSLFEYVASNGFPQVYFNLGLLNEKGRGGPVDQAEAIKCYIKASVAGSAVADFNLGGIYAEGRGVASDLAKAKFHFKRAGERGFSAGDYEYGLLCSNNFSLHKFDFDASRAFERASDAGHAGASFFLSRLARSGEGAAKMSESFYLERAERSGAEGHMQIAMLLLEGRHCSVEEDVGMKWLGRAAEMNLPEAKLMLAKLLVKGGNYRKDIPRALALFSSVEGYLDGEAWFIRGEAEMSVARSREDFESAVKSLMRSSEMGYLAAHLAMVRYLKTKGGKETVALLGYLRKAAASSVDAKYELASMLIDGPYQYREEKVALAMLHELCANGHGDAAFRLYRYYSTPASFDSSKEKASHFLDLAVSRGCFRAFSAKAKIVIDTPTKGGVEGVQEAFNLLQRASEERDFESMIMLSACRGNRLFGPVDLVESYKWRILAMMFAPDGKAAGLSWPEESIPASQREEGEYQAKKTYDRWISKGVVTEARELSDAKEKARAGALDSQIEVARMYEYGRRVPRNLSTAMAWYLLASKGGSKEATDAASSLRKRMTAGQFAEASMMASYLSK